MERLILEVTATDRAFLLQALQDVQMYVEANVNTGTVRIGENHAHWTLLKEPADPPPASPDEQQEGQP